MPREGDPFEGWEGFQPLLRASTTSRVLLFILGPLMWVVALAVFATVVRDDFAVEIGLLIGLVSFVVAFVLLALARSVRVRREAQG